MNVISFDEAVHTLLDTIHPAQSQREVEIRHAVGFACAEDIHATIPNPRFDNAAVDGYAVSRIEDAVNGARLRVALQLPAGSTATRELRAGECARIFTGAPAPPGCFAIAMQEDVAHDGDSIILQVDVQEGANIRSVGSDIGIGDLLIKSGDVITPESLALAYSQGLTTAHVFDKPRIGILSTGNELRRPGESLGPADVFETNAGMLTAMLDSTMALEPTTAHCSDDPIQTEAAIAQLAAQHDILVISGGASVGDHDHVPRAVASLGEVIFHGVALRPGKPALFGKVGGCFVFGLPGNPASSFVGFLLFALPAIRKLSGWRNPETRWRRVRFAASANAYPRDEYLRCTLDDEGTAKPVGHQGSFGLRSLAAADCLVRLPAHEATEAGDLRFATLLPRCCH